jgi:hypothetical protein
MIFCVVALVLATSAAVDSPSASQGVIAYSKPIQVDGFLLEWRETALRPAPGVPGCGWDAANTPEGLAGYVRVDAGDTCRPYNVVFHRAHPDTITLLSFVLDTGGTTGALWAVGRPEHAGVVVGEFLLPWDRVNLDSNGNYLLRMLVVRGCGQAAAEVVLAGNRWSPGTRIVTPKILVQAGLVGVLALVYLVFYLRIRRRNRRRGFPRQ